MEFIEENEIRDVCLECTVFMAPAECILSRSPWGMRPETPQIDTVGVSLEKYWGLLATKWEFLLPMQKTSYEHGKNK